MSIQQEIGRNIVYFRKKRDITQEVLAFDANMSTSYLRSIEHGYANPTIEALSRLAEVLNVPLKILLTPNVSFDPNTNQKFAEDFVPIPLTEYLFLDRALSFLLCENCQTLFAKEFESLKMTETKSSHRETKTFTDKIIKKWEETHRALQITIRHNKR